MSISSIVREARRRAGLSQSALAARAGFARSTVGRIQSGVCVPSTALSNDFVYEASAAWGTDRVYASASFTLRANIDELFLEGVGDINACVLSRPWGERPGSASHDGGSE